MNEIIEVLRTWKTDFGIGIELFIHRRLAIPAALTGRMASEPVEYRAAAVLAVNQQGE